MAYAPFDLTGKVALITGGNSGIGLGMADALAQAGADICVWGSNADKNAAARATLAPHGTRVVALQCDVGDEAAVERAFRATLDELGRVDACFANAGVSSKGTLLVERIEGDYWNVVGLPLAELVRIAPQLVVSRQSTDDSRQRP